MNKVTVKWNYGIIENFNCIKVHYGSDLLSLWLEDGKNMHIPFQSVQWFGISEESHQNDYECDLGGRIWGYREI